MLKTSAILHKARCISRWGRPSYFLCSFQRTSSLNDSDLLSLYEKYWTIYSLAAQHLDKRCDYLNRNLMKSKVAGFPNGFSNLYSVSAFRCKATEICTWIFSPKYNYYNAQLLIVAYLNNLEGRVLPAFPRSLNQSHSLWNWERTQRRMHISA